MGALGGKKFRERGKVVTNPADYPALAHELKFSGRLEPCDATGFGGKRLLRPRRAMTENRHRAGAAGNLRRHGDSGGAPRCCRSVCTSRCRDRPALRYGENPHQKAALYVPAGGRSMGAGGGETTAGQGTLLQQLGGTLTRAWGPGTGVRAARLGDREAQ